MDQLGLIRGLLMMATQGQGMAPAPTFNGQGLLGQLQTPPSEMPMPMARPEIHPTNNRPILHNGDGSISTEESITVIDPRLNGGRPTNIPSIWDGQRTNSDDEAVTAALNSGQAFNSFESIEQAVAAARARSEMLGATMGSGGFMGSQGY